VKPLLNVILLVGLLSSCFSKVKTQECARDLHLIATYALDIAEPSGLCMYEGGLLLCVSDEHKEAYVINTQGERQATFAKKGGDTEGVAYDSHTRTIYSADENDGLLRAQSLSDSLTQSWEVIEGSKKGLEGIALDPANERVFLLKEDQGLIHFYPSTGEKTIIPLDFAKDYSGLFFEESTKELWILSEESASLNRCSVEGTLIESYDLCISKAEGVVIDTKSGRIYIVSDGEEKLFVFEMK